MVDLNTLIGNIISMQQAGKNPQVLMNTILQSNPQYGQMLNQLKNMANGRNPQEFIMQLAQQNGVSQQNLQALQQMFGRK
jgi:hypothetical protein